MRGPEDRTGAADDDEAEEERGAEEALLPALSSRSRAAVFANTPSSSCLLAAIMFVRGRYSSDAPR
jgi:hypothetical protein